MKPKTAEFSHSYEDLEPEPNDQESPFAPWFDEMEHLRENPHSYQYVDAASFIVDLPQSESAYYVARNYAGSS